MALSVYLSRRLRAMAYPIITVYIRTINEHKHQFLVIQENKTPRQMKKLMDYTITNKNLILYLALTIIYKISC